MRRRLAFLGPIENVAAVKQSGLLKYFTDRFTNFRLEKEKFGLFEILFFGHNVQHKREIMLTINCC